MKFRRFTDYAEISECGRYTVSAAKVMGRWTFQGWRRGLFEGDIAILLTRRRTTIAEDARETCRRHAAAQAKREAA